MLKNARRLATRAVEWTGLEPYGCPGFRNGALHSLPSPRLNDRSELADYFENGWTLTEVLFSGLKDKAFYEPAGHGLRHPLIFYYGHPAALCVNKLRLAALTGPVNEHFEKLFETGVDEMSWDDLVGPSEWPQLYKVCDYRARVRDVMLEVLSKPLSHRDAWAIAMICEHERIHLETSSVLIRELDKSLVTRPECWPADHPSVLEPGGAPLQFRAVKGDTVVLGKDRGFPSYGWDNEYGSRSIRVHDFESSNLVTNGQFLDFVKDGGYANETYWSQDGWSWRSFRNAKWPHFWVPAGPSGLHEYKLRLPFEELDFLPLDLPAEVNAHEARAFTQWLQKSDSSFKYRLTSEAEHHALRSSDGVSVTLDRARANPQLDRDPVANINLRYGSPSAVDAVTQGNVWQWCEDDFAALPGFRVDPLYDDFSTPCFDGQHTVIHGGSFASTGNEASVFARFHFRPHFHQHAGFRVTRQDPSLPPPELTSYDPAPPFAAGWQPLKYADVFDEGAHKYESDAQLQAYVDLHYGRVLDDCAQRPELDHALKFPARCAQKLVDRSKHGGRALDVGCAVGGACAALAPHFDQVYGLDFSRRFIDEAKNRAPDCHFVVGDASNAADLASLGSFDAVLAANVLCRLPKPSTFLDSLPSLVNTDGIVLLASPYSFMPEYSPREEWLDSTSLQTEMTARGFALVEQEAMPLLIKDHARKYQYIVADALLFTKVGP